MDNRLEKLIIGALLHDIGKVVQRATGEKVKHSKLGKDFIEEIDFFKKDNDILNQIAYHHYQELKNAKLDEDDLSYITYIADNIASGTDRRSLIEGKTDYFHWDIYSNQEDIFNVFESEINQSNSQRKYYPYFLDDRDDIVPSSTEAAPFSKSHYSKILEKFKETLRHVNTEKEYLTSILNLLEATLSYVPSSTNQDEVQDISLFDHVKITAAIASCVYKYLKEKKQENYKKILFQSSQQFYGEEAFLLTSFDVSGIQSFIYTIRHNKALKMLRARSFYLEMLCENLIDTLLDRLELSRANLIYSGGGHGYLILPNTTEVKEIILETEKELNKFLQREFGIQLYVAFASTPLKSSVLMNNPEEYKKLYQTNSRQLSQKKIHRYSPTEILSLNALMETHGFECPICRKVHRYGGNADGFCSTCTGLINISNQLVEESTIFITKRENQLPLGFANYLEVVVSDQKKISAKLEESSEVVRVYSKNKFMAGLNQGVHLWMGDYSSTKHINEFAENAKGIKRLGVVRCDVDDLGQAFISGFPGHLNTLSRSATFSRMMSLFFKYHINKILEELKVHGTIIYAGGDDVFVIGEWTDMIRFAIKIREDFINFSQGKLTLSTGVGMFPAKTPVAIMAEDVGALEDLAKENEKDSIALFHSCNVFKWDRFIQGIWNEKLKIIESYFSRAKMEKAHGNAFIFQLMELLKERLEEERKGKKYKTISWARWAYYTAKMEPSTPKLKGFYIDFTRKLQGFFENEEDARELLTALEIYVYKNRGGE